MELKRPVPDVLVRPAHHRPTDGAGPERRRRRHHRHHRLVLLQRSRLGQPRDPPETRPEDHGEDVPAGGDQTPLDPRLRPHPAPAGPHRAVPWPARRARAGVLRRLLRVDADPAAHVEDIAWLRTRFDGPIVLKGVSRVDDARRAVDAGVSAVSVNHGGTTSTAPRRRSGACPRSPTPWATRSRSSWTAGCAAAATSSRRSPSAPMR